MNTLAVIFSGQGSQEPNMGRSLAEKNSEIMQLWKNAEKSSGLNLRNIYWDGDEAEQAKTQNLQPALTAVTLGLWMYAAPHLKPQCAAGHSLGEYSAAAACGAVSADKILELVALRGSLMAQADPDGKGAMAAVVKLKLPEVQALVNKAAEDSGKFIHIANFNTPGQYVVSGYKEAVAKIAELAKEAKGRAITLPVSGAFHSPLMQEASVELSKALDKVTFSKPRFAVWSNSLAQPIADADSLKAALKAQMTGPVRWIETVTGQWQAGVRQWLEFGPKEVLGKMIKPILSESGVTDDAYSVLSAGNQEAADEVLTALSK